MPRKGNPAYKTESNIFATRLREIMKERGENQTTLADKITAQYVTIQRQTISLYTSGQSKPDTERLAALAKTLDVSADWLLGLTDYRTTNVGMRDACEYFGLAEDTAGTILKIKNAHITAGNPIIRRLGWLFNKLVPDPEFLFTLRDLSRLQAHYSEVFENFSDDNPSGLPHHLEDITITDRDVLDALRTRADLHFQLLVDHMLHIAETDEYAQVEKMFPHVDKKKSTQE